MRLPEKGLHHWQLCVLVKNPYCYCDLSQIMAWERPSQLAHALK